MNFPFVRTRSVRVKSNCFLLSSKKRLTVELNLSLIHLKLRLKVDRSKMKNISTKQI